MTTITRNTIEALKLELESDEFYCDIGVASIVASLEKRLRRHPITEKLRRLVIESPDTASSAVDYAWSIARV